MKCYECSKNGKDSDALAICIICGRGVCKEHLVREETPVWEGEFSIKLKCGMGISCDYKDVQHWKKILCTSCHKALVENY